MNRWNGFFMVLVLMFGSLNVWSKENLDIRVVDVESLYNNHPEVLIWKATMKHKIDRLKKDNEDKLKELREFHAELNRLNKLIDNPAVAKNQREDLIRQRLILTRRHELSCWSRKDRISRLGEVNSLGRSKREFLKKVTVSIYREVKDLEVDMVLDKSARSLGGNKFVIYSAKNLDLSDYIRANINGDDKNAMTKEDIKALGLPYPKLKIATVNMTRLYDTRVRGKVLDKQEKMDELGLIVKKFAMEHGYHLVLDRSAESSQYSTVFMIIDGISDITANVLK